MLLVLSTQLYSSLVRTNFCFMTFSLMHYDDVTMGAIASQTTSLTIVYSTVYSGADQSKHQSSASLAFVWGIHRGPVNSPHKWPVTRKMFPFDDVIMGFTCIPGTFVSWLWNTRFSTRVSASFVSSCSGNGLLPVQYQAIVSTTACSVCQQKHNLRITGLL